MTIKLLPSKYWHIRNGLNRFAQWPSWEQPTNDAFFGWWTSEEKWEAVCLANEQGEKLECVGGITSRLARNPRHIVQHAEGYGNVGTVGMDAYISGSGSGRIRFYPPSLLNERAGTQPGTVTASGMHGARPRRRP